MADIVLNVGLRTDPSAFSALERDIAARTRNIAPIKIRVDRDQVLGRISRDAQEFQKSISAANARVLAFAASAGSLFTIQRGFNAILEATKNVEKSLADINVVFGLSNRQLKEFANSIFDVANKTGQSFDTAAKAALEFSRQGLSVEETLKRVNSALVLTRRSGLEVGKSVDVITAALNGLNDVTLDSIKIVNKFINVDTQFAVSTADLAEALQRVGSTATDAGVKIDSLIGLVTSAQQATSRGGSVIGNALKTIFQRIQRPEVLDTLRELNIQVEDQQGNLLAADRVLVQLARSYDTATAQQKNFITQLAAGVFQANQFKAILGDLSRENSVFSRATNVSRNSIDAITSQQDELNKTLAASLNTLVNNLTQASAKIGDKTLKPLFENIGKLVVNPVKKFADSSEAESGGAFIAKGILKGIGDFLSGPGLALASLLAAKFFGQFAKFSAQSLSTILESQRSELQTREQITALLARQPELTQQIVRGDLTREQVQQRILGLLKQELVVQSELAQVAIAVRGLSTGGLIRGGDTGFRLTPAGAARTSASGFIPEADKMAEIAGAYNAGYTPGQVKKIYVPNLANVVYNSAEKVISASSLQSQGIPATQPAIVPPESSRVADRYAKQFQSRWGKNPYSLASSGHVPNFARRMDYAMGVPEGMNPFVSIGKNPNAIALRMSLLRKFPNMEDIILGQPIKNWPNSLLTAARQSNILKIRAEGNVPNFAGFDPNVFKKILQGKKLSFNATKLAQMSHAGEKGLGRMADEDKNELLGFLRNPVLDSSRIDKIVPSRNGGGEVEVHYILPSNRNVTGGISGQYAVLAVHPDKDEARFVTLHGRRGIAAEGHVPNFNQDVGEQRFDSISSFLTGRVNRPLPTLSKNDYKDAIQYLGYTSKTQLNQDLKNGGFGGAFPFGRNKTSGIAELLKKRGFRFNQGFVPSFAGGLGQAQFKRPSLPSQLTFKRPEIAAPEPYWTHFQVDTGKQKLMFGNSPDGYLKALQASKDTGAKLIGFKPDKSSVTLSGFEGMIPNFASGALGYGQFKPNIFGLKNLFSNPKETLKQLPFRVGGSLAGFGAGLFEQFVNKRRLESQAYYSAARYLSGFGGVRKIQLKPEDVGNVVKNHVESGPRSQLQLFNEGKTFTTGGASSSPLFNTIGGFTLARRKGQPVIQDPFNFDNSFDPEMGIEGASKVFRREIPIPEKLQKYANKFFNKFGKKRNDYSYSKKIRFGPLTAQKELGFRERDTPVVIGGEDLDFAKYGSPFLTRVLFPKQATGLVPNFAKKLLGSGSFGNFFSFNKTLGGIKIGKKEFKKGVSLEEIEKEYHMSRALEDLKINPLFKFPKTIGSLERSLSNRRIGKEVIEGNTPREVPDGDYSAYLKSGLAGVLEPFQKLLESGLAQKGIVVDDFVGHSKNTILNPKATDIFRKIIKTPEHAERFANYLERKPQAIERISSSLAKKGAHFGVVDPGLFEFASGGSIPNFALQLMGKFPRNQIILAQQAMEQITSSGFALKGFKLPTGYSNKPVIDKGGKLINAQLKIAGGDASMTAFPSLSQPATYRHEYGHLLDALISKSSGRQWAGGERMADVFSFLSGPGGGKIGRQPDFGPAESKIRAFLSKYNDGKLGSVQDILKFNRASGHVPNFNNALTAAISREVSSGIQSSQVRIGTSPLLKSPINTAGLGVYNTKDEPGGLAQGIHRIAAMGLDPKRAGIPNYADFERTGGVRTRILGGSTAAYLPNPSREQEVLIQKELKTAVGQLVSKIKIGVISQEKVNENIKELSSAYGLTENSVNKITKLTERASTIVPPRRGLVDTVFSGPGGIKAIGKPDIAGPLSLIASSGSLSTKLSAESIPSITNPAVKTTINNILSKIRAGQTVNPNIANMLRFGGLNTEQVNAAKLLFNSQKQLTTTPKSPIVNAGPQTGQFGSSVRLTRQQSQAYLDTLVRPKDYRDELFPEQVDPNYKERQEFERKKKEGEASYQARQNQEAEQRAAIVKEKEIARQITADRQRLDRFGGFGSLLPISGKTRAARDRLAQSNPELLNQLRTSTQTRLLLGSTLAPIIGGVASEGLLQLTGGQTRGSRGSAQAISSLTNVAAFAGAGAAFGPVGIGIGAGLGALTEIPKIFKAFTSVLPDLDRELQSLKETTQSTTSSIAGAVDASEKLADVFSGKATGVTNRDILQLQSVQQQNLLKIPNIRARNEIQTLLASGDVGEARRRGGIFAGNAAQQEGLKQLQKDITSLTESGELKSIGNISSIKRQLTLPAGSGIPGGLSPTSISFVDIESEIKKTANAPDRKLLLEKVFGNIEASVLSATSEQGKSLFETIASDKGNIDKVSEAAGKGVQELSNAIGDIALKSDFDLSTITGITKAFESIKSLGPEAVERFKKTLSAEGIQKQIEANEEFKSSIEKQARELVKTGRLLDENTIKFAKLVSATELKGISGLAGLQRSGDVKESNLANKLQIRNIQSGGGAFSEAASSFLTSNLKNKNSFEQNVKSASTDLTTKIQESVVAYINSLGATAKEDLDKLGIYKEDPEANRRVGIIIESYRKRFQDFLVEGGSQDIDSLRKIIEQIGADNEQVLRSRSELTERAQKIQNFKGNIGKTNEPIGNFGAKGFDLSKLPGAFVSTGISKFNIQNEISAIGAQISITDAVEKHNSEITKALNIIELEYKKTIRSLEENNKTLNEQEKLNLRNNLAAAEALNSRELGKIRTTGRGERAIIDVERRASSNVLGRSPLEINKIVSESQGQTNFLNRRTELVKNIPNGIGAFVEKSDNLSSLENLRDNLFGSVDISKKIKEANSLKNSTNEIDQLKLQNLTEELDTYTKINTAIAQLKQDEATRNENLKKTNEETARQLKLIENRSSFTRNRNQGAAIKGDFGQINKELGKTFLSELDFGREDFFNQLSDDIQEFGKDFKGAFKSGFADAITGAKDFGDAMRGIGLSIAQSFLTKTSNLAVDSLLGLASQGLGGGQNSGFLTKLIGKKAGGPIPKYAKGGYVNMGSGVKDDVPAFLSGGEFVIKKSAVENVGVSTLDKINNNAPLPKQTDNVLIGDNSISALLANEYYGYGSRKRPTRGELNVSSALSDFALNDENNPKNRLRLSREQYFIDLKAYQKNKAKALADFEKKKKTGLYMAIGTTAFNFGLSNYFSGAGASKSIPGDSSVSSVESTRYGYQPFTNPAPAGTIYNPIFNSSFKRANGGLIKGYNGGGRVFGGDMYSDRVPAMLMGGEFVVKKSVVDKYGSDFFNNINGSNSKGYAYGGVVGNTYSPSRGLTNQNEASDYFSRLVDISTEIRDSLVNTRDNNKSPATNNEEVKNNFEININITMAENKAAAEKVTTNGNTQQQAPDDRKQGRGGVDKETAVQLSNLVKNQVMEVLGKESRPGGLLNQIYKTR